MIDKVICFLFENFATSLIVLFSWVFARKVYVIFDRQVAYGRFLTLVLVLIFTMKYYTWTEMDSFILKIKLDLLIAFRFVELDTLVKTTQFFLKLTTLMYCVIVRESLESYKVTNLDYYLIYLATVLGFGFSVMYQNPLILHFTVELTSVYVYIRTYYFRKRPHFW